MSAPAAFLLPAKCFSGRNCFGRASLAFLDEVNENTPLATLVPFQRAASGTSVAAFFRFIK
jgi:hypothetical protein